HQSVCRHSIVGELHAISQRNKHKFRTITVALLLPVCGQETSPVIVEYTRYRIEELRRDSLEKSYSKSATYLSPSNYCLAYKLSRCTENPEHYVLRIGSDSEDGHLQGYRSRSAFKAFFALVQPFVNDIEEMRHYAVLGSARKPIEAGKLLV